MPLSDCQVRDPRIRRTRKLLQGALMSLMRTKRFDEISVQDITDAATVNRATFYDHYTDKYALLEALVAGGFHELLDERHLRYQSGCPRALSAIIQATCDYLAQAHSAGSCDRQTTFEPLMDAAIMAAIRRLLLEGLKQAEPADEFAPELIAASVSAAIVAGVKQWFNTPEGADANDFVAQLTTLLLPMLESTAREGSPVAAAVHQEA